MNPGRKKAFRGLWILPVLATLCWALPTTKVLAAGSVSLGEELTAWTTNYSASFPFNGSELLTPLAFDYRPDSSFGLYGQSEFAHGDYTDSTGQVTTTNMLNFFSDTVIGTELHFQSLSLPALLNVGLNLPTGDTGWETKQIASNIPTEFVDSRYRGRGFGVSALYGLAFPSGGGEFGAAVGYMYAGAFNPGYGVGLPAGPLKLGDSVYLSLNHVQASNDNQTEIIRLTSFVSLPTQNNGQNIYQLGPNFNASYSRIDTKALSFEAGIQYWLPGQRPDTSGNLVAESYPYYGARFYLNPSYSFGDFSLGAQLKYVLPNGYPTSDAFYDDGGFLAGIQPSYLLKLDNVSNLKITGSYDYIAWMNRGRDASQNLTNVIYNYFTFEASYELKL